MITHVAIRERSGTIWALPAPKRHHDVIRFISASRGREEALDRLADHVQGFLNDQGEFLDRAAAWREAEQCRQLLPRASDSGELYSECVW